MKSMWLGAILFTVISSNSAFAQTFDICTLSQASKVVSPATTNAGSIEFKVVKWSEATEVLVVSSWQDATLNGTVLSPDGQALRKSILKDSEYLLAAVAIQGSTKKNVTTMRWTEVSSPVIVSASMTTPLNAQVLCVVD